MKPGFSLLEIAIVMLILGVLLSIGMPKIFKSYNNAIDKFIAQTNNITQTGVQAAINSNNIQKIVINTDNLEISLFNTQDNKLISKTSIPEEINITSVQVNGKNQLGANNSSKIAAFLINSEGIGQKVNLIFTSSQSPQNIYKLKLNPFSAQFKLS